MMSSPPEMYVHALYNFDYETEDGKKVSMREGEEFLLLKKTNGDWWQVIRDGERRPFYAPANYVQEIEQPALTTSASRRPLLLHAKSRSVSCASVQDGGAFRSTVGGTGGAPGGGGSQLRHSASSAQELASAARSLRGYRGLVGPASAAPTSGKRLPHFRFEAIDLVGSSKPPAPLDVPVTNGKVSETAASLNGNSKSTSVSNNNSPATSTKSAVILNVASAANPASRTIVTPPPKPTPTLNSSVSSPALSLSTVPDKHGRGGRASSESPRGNQQQSNGHGTTTTNTTVVSSRAPSPAVRSQVIVTVAPPPLEHTHLLGRSGSPSVRPQTPSRITTISSSSSEDLIDTSPVSRGGSKETVVPPVDNRGFANVEEGDKNRRNQAHHHHHHRHSNGNVNNNDVTGEGGGDVIGDNNNGNHLQHKVKPSLPLKTHAVPEKRAPAPAKPPPKKERRAEVPRKADPAPSTGQPASRDAHPQRRPASDRGTETRLTPERWTPSNVKQPRPPSPIYANFPLLTSPVPPSPESRQFPIRSLDGDWAEFEDAQGRKYYYNYVTHDKSWKPPRRRSSNSKPSSEAASPAEDSPQPDSDSDERGQDTGPEALHSPTPESLKMPPGWTRSFDSDVGEVCYVNDLSKAKWFMSTDECGRVYYYQENAQESFWQLPEVVIAQTDSGGKDKDKPAPTISGPVFGSRILEEVSTNSLHRSTSSGSPPILSHSPRRRPKSLADRGTKTRSAYFGESNFSLGEDSLGEAGPVRSSTLPKSLTCHNVNMIQKVIMQGILFKTKLSESGKKMRKNWSSSNVILTERALYLFKDFKPLKDNSPNKSEVAVELAGAQIEWTPDKSSRRNVFQITGLPDIQLLFQDDEAQNAKKWFEAIASIIEKLPSEPFIPLTVIPPKPSEPVEPIKSSRLMRRSTKRVDAKGSGSSSTEDLDATSSTVEKKSKIRDKLRMFFIRRPTVESLREKGIYEEGPVFGSDLQTVCTKEKVNVPKFVIKCIAAIEEKDMTADGLYRASGNLSQVQKIRFKINQDNYDILTIEEDVHVLTGALKMFFRELKEPLFPCKMFDNFLKAMDIPDRAGKIVAFRELISSLPLSNYFTLKYLLEHLLKVTEYSDLNRMHIQNLAIVFGPTLMWSGSNLANIANDVIHQNQIIEFLLLEFASIFNR